MSTIVILSLGYLTVPFVVKHSLKTVKNSTSCSQWSFASTICIASFVHSPPTIYPTLEKHVFEIATHANQIERETHTILSKALEKNGYGIALLSTELLGILSPTSQHHVFTLQVIQFDSSTITNSPKEFDSTSIRSYSSLTNNQSISDLDQLPKPVELMELCQQLPNSQSELTTLAQRIYKTASLYGYWDYWRVFEGICQKYHVNSHQLLN